MTDRDLLPCSGILILLLFFLGRRGAQRRGGPGFSGFGERFIRPAWSGWARGGAADKGNRSGSKKKKTKGLPEGCRGLEGRQWSREERGGGRGREGTKGEGQNREERAGWQRKGLETWQEVKARAGNCGSHTAIFFLIPVTAGSLWELLKVRQEVASGIGRTGHFAPIEIGQVGH